MKSITIIGGSGFIGTNLIEKLQDDENNILNIDKVASAVYPQISAVADVRNADALQQALTPSEWVVLLAAEHKDDVSPANLYYDVNVSGAKNVLDTMDKTGIKKIIFTSSVAIYGLDKNNPDETHPADPFNHYGKSKWQTEELLREWFNKNPDGKTLIIIRPTVVFGPGNRGNVYNLLAQIAGGKFLMIGKGKNKKSMAYVDNIASFIQFCMGKNFSGYHVFNYADKPDLTTLQLVESVETALGKKLPSIRIPYGIGYLGGLCFDIMSKLIRKKFAISAVRIKKFCATTQFSADKTRETGYTPTVTLQEGIKRTIASIRSSSAATD
jgi:nucleoside-diphosphate-sugar epimerase